MPAGEGVTASLLPGEVGVQAPHLVFHQTLGGGKN